MTRAKRFFRGFAARDLGLRPTPEYLAERKKENLWFPKEVIENVCLPFFKKIPEILVGNFRLVRTVRVAYHLPKISGLSRRARLDSSYNMKLVRNSRNL